MEQLRQLLQEQFKQMMTTGYLFISNISGNKVWEIYLDSFPEEKNPIFRDPLSTTHNCNHCKNFIRRYGNIIAINSVTLEKMSLFDIQNVPEEYEEVCNNLSSLLTASPIGGVFVETIEMLDVLPYESNVKKKDSLLLGVLSNAKAYTKEEAEKYGVVKPNETRMFHHFALTIDKSFIDYSGKSVESLTGEFNTDKELLEKGLDSISLDVLQLARDLINQDSLLNGKSYLDNLNLFINVKKEYETIPEHLQDNWLWLYSKTKATSRFKNTLLGTFCIEIMEGKELNKACMDWNKRADPVNYMKATAPITKAQIKLAEQFVTENGYTESFNRRLAVIDDIRVTEIKHINNDKKITKGVSLFDDVKPSKTTKRMNFDGIEEISVKDFMDNILPNASSVEAYLENRFENNMVIMTKGENDNKPIFKWDNNYSWTYNGNLTGKSEIKQNVKSLGGKIDGVLRFSISWAEGNDDNSDLDAHCIEPDKNRIYFSNRKSNSTGGNLDVDILTPEDYKRRGKPVLENITFPTLSKMKNGTYSFMVHQFSARRSQGFRAEIEFNNQIFTYDYPNPVSGYIAVAEVTLKDGIFTIDHKLNESTSSREIYGLDTNKFYKVNLMCLSPNHWGDNSIGNKHYFFMIEGCEAKDSVRSFHVENLNNDLLQHRKVMEVLANTTMVEPTSTHLAGLGFNETVRDHLIVKVKGTFNRILKIKF